MTRVLMLGRTGPVYLSVARSCRRQNCELHLLDLSGPAKAGRFRWLHGHRARFPRELIGTQEGLDRINAYAHEIGAGVLIASGDKELVWLAENRDVFEPSCKVLVQSAESLRRLLSKRYQLEIAVQVGFPVLPTFILANPEDVAQVPATAFPLVLRPSQEADVQPVFKMRLIESPAQLEDFVGGIEVLRSPLIAQTYLDSPNLVVHGVRSTDGEVLASRCFIVPRKFEGVTLAIEPYSFPEGLEQMCNDFAAKADITGCYHFEFLFSPEEMQAYFLEINVRMGGTTDKVMRLGFDEPALLLRAFHLPSPVPLPVPVTEGRVVNKRALLKHILWAARGKLTEFDYPVVGRARQIALSCRDLLLAKDSIFDWRDLRGSLWFHLQRPG